MLLLWATVAAQAAQFVPGWHHHDGASHCCWACQAARLPAVAPAARCWNAPATAVAWRLDPERSVETNDPAVRTACSRDPPA